MKTATTALSERQMIKAWKRRDAGFDGVFYFGVKTTGVFCRPSCPSRPKRENMEFFHNAGEAVGAGYRPCKRCRPELANGQPPEWVAQLMQRAADAPDQKISSRDLRSLGVTQLSFTGSIFLPSQSTLLPAVSIFVSQELADAVTKSSVRKLFQGLGRLCRHLSSHPAVSSNTSTRNLCPAHDSTELPRRHDFGGQMLNRR